MADRVISSRLSQDVVELMLKRGMTLSSIADAIGVTKSFLSRVKSRQRSLTIDHLMALETYVDKPLPLLLMEATPIESVAPSLRPLYRATKRMVGGARTGVKKRVLAAA